jgi:hypothetical protein
MLRFDTIIPLRQNDLQQKAKSKNANDAYLFQHFSFHDRSPPK